MTKYVFVIGRFQNFHIGHQSLLETASLHGEKLVVLVGSANAPKSIRNPYTYEQRAEVLKAAGYENVYALNDYHNDNVWVSQVKALITSITNGQSYCIAGSNKDESTYYLNIFGDVKVVQIPQFFLDGGETVNATKFRNAMFAGFSKGCWPTECEKYQSKSMKANHLLMEQFSRVAPGLIDEWRNVKEYSKLWSGSPFPPIFVTADNVVCHRDKFLAIVRKGHPGRGLLALPGGFIDDKETIRVSALRELREETSIEIFNPRTGSKVPFQNEWFIKSQVFDSPSRSIRGRTITHAFHWQIPDALNVSIAAADDAADALWLPLTYLDDPMNMANFMEDHFSIIKTMVL